MTRTWTQTDVDSLEAIDASDDAREVVLRAAELVHSGRLGEFRELVETDEELDEATRAWVLEIVANEAFLLAAELHLSRSRDRN